jgi:glucose-1-phosphate thymidylyltransferase
LHGDGLAETLRDAADGHAGATIFAYEVRDPRPFGVVEIDADARPVSLEEKPPSPRSRLAVPGIFFYDGDVVDVARGLAPSARGELEITDVSRAYLDRGRLTVRRLGPDVTWLDTGTHDSLLAAGNYVHDVQRRTGRLVGAIEEVAWRMGYIDGAQLERLAESQPESEYGRYLRGLVA